MRDYCGPVPLVPWRRVCHGDVGQCAQQLLSVGGTKVNLAGVEKAEHVGKEFIALTSMTWPFRCNLCGTITDVEELRFTRDDVAQRSVQIVDGIGVKVLLHGYWAEEDMACGQKPCNFLPITPILM